MEVETPVLSQAGNSDPNIHNISTDGRAKKYLRTSPEYAMKRLLASGHRDIYEMGRVFRAGEAGRYHNPEFTLLEWYRLGWKYLDLAEEATELIRFCGHGQFDYWPVNWVTYSELFRQETGLDPLNCGETDLESCALERGIQAGPMDHQEWLDLVLSEVIQATLPGETFTILYEFPPEQAALARIRGGDTPVAERLRFTWGKWNWPTVTRNLPMPVSNSRGSSGSRQWQPAGLKKRSRSMKTWSPPCAMGYPNAPAWPWA